MTTSRFFPFLLLALLATSLTGCATIGGIFKGGIMVGAIGVFLLVLLIWWLVRKMSGGGSSNSNDSSNT